MKNTTHNLKRILGLAIVLGITNLLNAQVINGYRPFDLNNEFSNDTITANSSTDLSFKKGQFTSGWTFFPVNTSHKYLDYTLNTNNRIDKLIISPTRGTGNNSSNNREIKIFTERFFFITGVKQPFSYKVRQVNNSGGQDLTIKFSIVDENGNSPTGLSSNIIHTDIVANATSSIQSFEYSDLSPISGIYRIEISISKAGSFNTNYFVEFSDFETDYSLLPVNYANLQAKQVLEGVQVKWTTSEEINNSHFNIERSTDGENWDLLGTVDGNGNSHQEISYSFTDYAPVNGLNLYRLEQVDFDGQAAYSDIMPVLISDKGAIQDVQLFPNPSTGGVSIQGIPYESMRVMNLSGKVLYENTNVSKHDLQFLDKGIYFIEIKGLDASVTRHKFLKD